MELTKFFSSSRENFVPKNASPDKINEQNFVPKNASPDKINEQNFVPKNASLIINMDWMHLRISKLKKCIEESGMIFGKHIPIIK
jgi:hypothetical protein